MRCEVERAAEPDRKEPCRGLRSAPAPGRACASKWKAKGPECTTGTGVRRKTALKPMPFCPMHAFAPFGFVLCAMSQSARTCFACAKSTW